MQLPSNQVKQKENKQPVFVGALFIRVLFIVMQHCHNRSHIRSSLHGYLHSLRTYFCDSWILDTHDELKRMQCPVKSKFRVIIFEFLQLS